MAGIGLSSVINAKLISRFKGVASGNASAATSVKNALSGTGGVSLSSALRVGARTYATAVQALSATASFLNVSKDTLQKLDKITDKLIDLTDRAKSRQTSSQARSDLDRQFKQLGAQFEKMVKNASIGDKEYLTRDGLEALFVNIGLDPKTSKSVADIFAKFATPDKDNVLASEAIKGRRPVPIPSCAFAGPVSDTEYQLEKVTDSNLNAGHQFAGIYQNGEVYSDTDDILNQNPGDLSLFIRSGDGSVVSVEAGSLTTGNTLVKALDETTGYSVISSQNDFLGYNGTHSNNLFLVDASGVIVSQITNVTLAIDKYDFGDVSISSVDPSLGSVTVAYAFSNSSGFSYDGVNIVQGDFVTGADPATYTTTNLETGTPGIYSNVQVDNYSHTIVFEKTNSPSDNNVEFYDRSATFINEAKFNSADVLGIGFLSESTLAIFSNDGGDYRVDSYATDGSAIGKIYDFDEGTQGDPVFAAFEDNTTGIGAFAVGYTDAVGDSSKIIEVYDGTDSGIPFYTYTLSPDDTLTSLSMALNAQDSTKYDVGILGTLSGESGDSEQEFYRIKANKRSTTGQRFSDSSLEFDSIFNTSNNIRTRGGAYRMSEDLKALKDQIGENIKALDKATKFLTDNIDLVRATGLAFLSISNQITTEKDADSVAARIRAEIRRNARGALAQADNLDPITVAALTFDPNSLK